MKKIVTLGISALLSLSMLYCRTEEVTVEQYEKEVKSQDATQPGQDTQQKDTAQEVLKETVIEQPVQEQKVEQSIEGKYTVEGKGATGAAYNGVLDVIKKGEGYNLTMKLKAKIIKGTGKLDGSNFTVFWGKNRRFEYELKEDGTIMSNWAKGQEIFTPMNK